MGRGAWERGELWACPSPDGANNGHRPSANPPVMGSETTPRPVRAGGSPGATNRVSVDSNAS